MSLLIRKTKKCCAKLLRKLQLSNSAYQTTVPANNQNCNNQQSTKNEKLAKNNNSVQKRTNNHQPQQQQQQHNNQHHHHHHRRSHFNPHSESFVYHPSYHNSAGNTNGSVDLLDCTLTSSNHRLSGASYCIDADDEHERSIMATTAFNGNQSPPQQSHPASKRQVRSKRRPTDSSVVEQLSETQLPREFKPRYAAALRHAEDTIIFTDNQIYVALEDEDDDDDDVNNDANGNGYNDSNAAITTGSSIDTNNAEMDLHNNLNNLASAPGLTGKLIDKCPFHISSQLQEQQRRTAYANNRHNLCNNIYTNGNMDGPNTLPPVVAPEQLFEKVKFDPTKRYMQPASPSSVKSAHIEGCPIPAATSYEDFIYDKCTQARTSSMYVDDQLLDSTFVQYWPFGREPVTVAAATAKFRQQQQQHQQQQLLQHQQQHQQHQHNQQMLRQQQQQQQQQKLQQQKNTEQRRWNAAYEMDDGYVHQNSVLDNHRNRIRIDVSVGCGGASPSLSSGSGSSAGASDRSSIGTTETWLDDEAFDNSLNEELVIRCAGNNLRAVHVR